MKKPLNEKFDGIVVQGEKFIQFIPADILANESWVNDHLIPILKRQDPDITVEEINAAVKAAQK